VIAPDGAEVLLVLEIEQMARAAACASADGVPIQEFQGAYIPDGFLNAE
jgi:hypothetical protein